MTDNGGPLLLLLLADLLLESRIEDAAQRLGLRTSSVHGVAALPTALAVEAPRAVVLDVASAAFPLEETVQALRGDGGSGSAPPVLALYPHVNRALGDAAQRAGCAIVVPRSRFVADLPALLSRIAGSRAPAAADGGA